MDKLNEPKENLKKSDIIIGVCCSCGKDNIEVSSPFGKPLCKVCFDSFNKWLKDSK